MLSSIHIQGFKGFKDTKIEPLCRVNLIVGGQNSGKTSVLEAIHYVHGTDDKNHLFGVRSDLPAPFRLCEGNDRRRHWDEIFGNPSTPKKFLVETVVNRQIFQVGGYHQFGNKPNLLNMMVFNTKEFEYTVFWSGSKPKKNAESLAIGTYPMEQSKLVELYGKIVRTQNKKNIIQLLKKIEPRIESIEAIAPDSEHRVYIELEKEGVLPMSMLGQGFSRLFDIYSKLLVSESKLVLIDELENGIHYSALPTVWQGIANIARELDIQLFITTHSYECIQAATKVFEATPDDFQVIRLERTEDNVEAKCIPGDRVASVLERGWEIR